MLSKPKKTVSPKKKLKTSFCQKNPEMSHSWSSAPHWKCGIPATVSRVRIPSSPPEKSNAQMGILFLSGMKKDLKPLQRSCRVRQQVDFTSENVVKSLRLPRRHKVPRKSLHLRQIKTLKNHPRWFFGF